MENWNVYEIVVKQEDGKKPELALLTDNGVGEGPYVGSIGEKDLSVSGTNRRVNLQNVNQSVLELLRSGHAFHVINLEKDTVEPVSLV